MSNTILTPAAATRETMMILHNAVRFSRYVNRQYDDSFAQSGAKIGTALKIRKPNKYSIRTGAAINVQNTTEDSVTLTVATQKGVDVSFSSLEETMSIQDFSDRVLLPAVTRLATAVDSDGTAEYINIYNQVGTAGTIPATAQVWLDAGSKIDNFTAPRDGNRTAVLNPLAMSRTVSGLSGLFQNARKISDQYDTGLVVDALGLNFEMSQNTPIHTNGAVGSAQSITTSGSQTEGSSTLVISGSGTSIATGTVFTIAGIYAVNPETGASTGELAQFVCTGQTDATHITISPSLSTSTSAPNATISALPSNGTAITFVGLASTGYAQSLVFHKDAFALACADLIMPQGVHFAGRKAQDGFSIRVVRQYDINNDLLPMRIDMLYGWKTIRPEWACRVTS